MISFKAVRWVVGVAYLLACLAFANIAARADETAPARDPKQPINEAYTAKIRKYTTAATRMKLISADSRMLRSMA